jgi:hypothetical protein
VSLLRMVGIRNHQFSAGVQRCENASIKLKLTQNGSETLSLHILLFVVII